MWLLPDQSTISSNQPYIDSNGTQYPASFPKNQIEELTPVTTAEQPAITQHQSASYTIVGAVQTWTVTDWTPEQIEQERLMSVPQSVPMWAAREVLIDAGLLDQTKAVFAAIVDPIEREKAQAKFEYSGTVKRDDPLIQLAVDTLGLTDLQVDDLFVAASKL